MSEFESPYYNDCTECRNGPDGEATGQTGNVLSPGRGICQTCEGRTIIFTEKGAHLLQFLSPAKRDLNLRRG